jgi:aminomethyltransferase
LPEAARDAALALQPFQSAQFGAWFVARTGYTGEDGFEILVPATQAESAWQDLRARGVIAAGLGARDTLRLEAGFSLYGNELDDAHHPLESGLAWTVALEPRERDFIGRAALERARRQGCDRLVGLLLEDRGVLRGGQPIASPAGSRAGRLRRR